MMANPKPKAGDFKSAIQNERRGRIPNVDSIPRDNSDAFDNSVVRDNSKAIDSRLNIRMNEAMLEQIKLLAHVKGVTVTELVTSLLRNDLSANRDNIKTYLSMRK